MTLQEQIMQHRTAQGLQLVIRHEDGSEHTLYPATAAKKAAWKQDALRKGYTIVKE